jgi:hypothetical protein
VLSLVRQSHVSDLEALAEYVQRYASKDAGDEVGAEDDEDDEMSSVGSFDARSCGHARPALASAKHIFSAVSLIHSTTRTRIGRGPLLLDFARHLCYGVAGFLYFCFVAFAHQWH